MRHIRDPEEMTQEERLRELAAILAAGFSRLKKRTGYVDAVASSDMEHADGPGRAGASFACGGLPALTKE